MQQAKHLVTAIKNITNPGDQVMMGLVVNVDKDKAVCDVDINDLEIGEVRLQANIKSGQKGLKVFPIVGSWVLIQKLGQQGNYFVSMVSEVDDYLLEIAGVSFRVTDGFLIKKDDDTLKQALTLLIEAVQNIVVIEGRNPDRIKLQEALEKVNNILK